MVHVEQLQLPLNTVTTIAELYIGFLVGASTNRTERHNREQADGMEALEKLIHDELQKNTEMTNDVRGMAQDMKAPTPDDSGHVHRARAVRDRPDLRGAPGPAMDSKVVRAADWVML